MFSVEFILLALVYYSEADIQISGSVMTVSRVKSLKCSSDVNLSRYPGRMVAYHQWNQVYPGESGRFVSHLRAIEALNSEYTVELQKFDHNTNIFSSFSVYNASNGFQHVFNLTIHCSGAQRKLISLVDDGFYQYQIDQIFTYVGLESVNFSCLQYLHLTDNIQIGWINTAGDKIFIYNQTKIIMKAADVQNGSMLCCLYYTTSAYKNGKHIQRFVKDITLMIYQKEMPKNGGQPSGTTTETYCERESNRNITETSTTTQFITDTSNATGQKSNTTNHSGKTTGTTNKMGKNTSTTNETAQNTGKTTGTTNETGKNTGTTNETGKNTGTTYETGKNTGTTNETGKNTGTTNEIGKTTGITNVTDSGDHDAVADNNYVIIIISSISAIMLLLLVGICAIKKRCCNKTNRPERAQLPLPQIPGARLRPTNNEPDSNTPFYLNLLFRRECEQEIRAQEEPHYEEVTYQ